MPSFYETGSTFEVRGERWTLARVQRFDACTVLTLGGSEPSNASRTLKVLHPFDRPRAIVRQKLRRRPRRAVLRAALGAVASARRAQGLWSAAAAAIEVWPYQLEPALAVIGGATRVLLADAVGLGKTIQAGLILAELRARGWNERALIVCPSGLKHTWAHELRERFGLAAAVVDHAALAGRIATLPPGMNPWGGDPITIVSVDLLKRPEVMAALEQVPVDLLIADEAHHLTPGTERGAAVSRLAERAPWVVLLSATPHSGDAAAFAYLTAIGRHSDPLAVFRRTRIEIGVESRRRTHVLPVQPSEGEQALVAAVDRYARAIWRERGGIDHAARLVAITIARRATSSVDALTRTLSRRLALLSGDPVREAEQGMLPWDEADDTDAIEHDAVLAARGLADADTERTTLEHLIALAGACGTGSKIRRVLRLLRMIREPVLIFTEYRDTLHAIASQLGDACSVMHGGMPAAQRQDVASRFNDGGVHILVATDAAGEGLNLHHRCRLVIDVELPWNPLRLEQRVGRVDRIGQQRTVHAIRLFHAGTIEDRVLEHLRLRRRRADLALEECASDSEMAAAVFDDRSPVARPALPRSPAMASAGVEACRIVWQRSVRAIAGTSSTRCWTSSRSGPMLALHRTTFVDEAGLPVADRIDAQEISLARTPPNRREWRRLVEAIALQQDASVAVAETAQPPRDLAARILAIRAMLAHRTQVAYQRSLFDARADADAALRDATAARLDAALDRVSRVAAAPSAASARTELVAAWPGRRR
jgi:superfamily II DNA or RNA helicase